jgi:hypothetical protein
MLTRYHANGDVDDRLVQEEFDQICKNIEVEADLKSAARWTAFLKTKGDRHRLAICIVLGFMQEWTGNGTSYIDPLCAASILTISLIGVISYYLAPILLSVGISDASHQAAVNISLQVWNLIFAVVGASSSDRYGRRVLWLSATTLMLVFLSTSTTMAGLFAEMNLLAAGITAVPMLFLFCAAYDFAYMPLFIAYPAEILPFQLRAKGLTTDSIACFFNQYVNPVAFEALQWKYFIAYIGCLVVAISVVYFSFPETQGKSLEEISKIFEKDEISHREIPEDSKELEEGSYGLKSDSD